MKTKVKISDICELKYGKALKSENRLGGEYPVYGSSGIVGYHNEYLVNKPTLIIGRKGSVGEVYLSEGPCWPIDTAYYLEYDARKIDLNWFRNLLLTLNLKSLDKSAAVPGLNRNDVYRLDVFVPLLHDQIRITSILDKAQLLINQRKESLRLLDELLRSTFLKMFGDPVRNEKGFEKVELKNFGEIITGNTPPRANQENYSSNFIEWVKTDNIQTNKIYVTSAVEYLSKAGLETARTVSKGALLVACIAGSIESVGRAALADRLISFNQQINAIQPNAEVNSFYLYWLFKISKNYVQNHASKGMKKILTKGEFQRIKMQKPPFELQNQFARLVEKTEFIKTHCQLSLQEVENLFGSLSQKAFNEELLF